MGAKKVPDDMNAVAWWKKMRKEGNYGPSSPGQKIDGLGWVFEAEEG